MIERVGATAGLGFKAHPHMLRRRKVLRGVVRASSSLKLNLQQSFRRGSAYLSLLISVNQQAARETTSAQRRPIGSARSIPLV
jgi:hypothetical protein